LLRVLANILLQCLYCSTHQNPTLMKRAFFALLLLAGFHRSSQAQSVNRNQPIASYDYHFDATGALTFVLTLNTANPADSNSLIPLSRFSANVTGKVDWTNPPAANTAREFNVKFTPQTNSSGEIYCNAVISSPAGVITKPGAGNSNNWKRLYDVQISYSTDAQSVYLPKFSVSPQIFNAPSSTVSLSVNPTAQITSSNEVVITFNAAPLGNAYKLSSVSVTPPGGVQMVYDESNWGGAAYLFSGTKQITLTGLPWNAGSYKVVADAVETASDQTISMPATSVYFEVHTPYEPTGPFAPVSIVVTNNNDATVVVPVKGSQGKTGIEFELKEVAEKVTVVPDPIAPNSQFKLSNLNNIPYSSCNAYYTVDGRRTSANFKLSRYAPKIKDLTVNTVDNGNVNCSFTLPSWVDPQAIEIDIPGGITFKGDQIKGTSNRDGSVNYAAKIPATFFADLKKDTVIKANVVLRAKSDTLNNLTVVFINGALMEQKIKELMELSDQKKIRGNDKDSLTKKVTEIAKIVNKAGAAIENTDINALVAEIADENAASKADRVKKGVVTVLKWVAKVGPAVLPFLVVEPRKNDLVDYC